MMASYARDHRTNAGITTVVCSNYGWYYRNLRTTFDVYSVVNQFYLLLFFFIILIESLIQSFCTVGSI